MTPKFKVGAKVRVVGAGVTGKVTWVSTSPIELIGDYLYKIKLDREIEVGNGFVLKNLTVPGWALAEDKSQSSSSTPLPKFEVGDRVRTYFQEDDPEVYTGTVLDYWWNDDQEPELQFWMYLIDWDGESQHPPYVFPEPFLKSIADSGS